MSETAAVPERVRVQLAAERKLIREAVGQLRTLVRRKPVAARVFLALQGRTFTDVWNLAEALERRAAAEERAEQ